MIERADEILAAMERLRLDDAVLVESPLRVLLPLACHRAVLAHETVVVLGERGTGKSLLARGLVDAGSSASLGAVLEGDVPARARWFDAFSQRSDRHRNVAELDTLARDSDDEGLRRYWLSSAFVSLIQELNLMFTEGEKSLGMSEELVQEVRASQSALAAYKSRALSAVDSAHVSQIVARLDDVSAEFKKVNLHLVAVYDDLDQFGMFDPALRSRLIRTLLATWTSLSTRYTHLRAKIFLPSELLDVDRLDTPDASKLLARAQHLRWDDLSLFRALLRHLGRDEATRQWLTSIPGISFEDRGAAGWMPGTLSEPSLEAWMTSLTRRLMSHGETRGLTHRWILNRLRDAHGRVLPRSLLTLIGEAAQHERSLPKRSAQSRLLSPESLVHALDEVSKRRVKEIAEVYPWVHRLAALRGMSLPVPRDEAESRLATNPPDAEDLPARPGVRVVDDLIRFGVLRANAQGALEMPDLYRLHFKLIRGTVSRAA
ncbi:MAG: hypothetical protein JWM10_4112 [Myxococcaceae bacterium]|nr:hypothetical protein [Myxococcaceae bacterium]